MLSLTRKSDYALVALVHLARQAPGRASARQIAERFQVPLPMLMNILKELMNCGLVSSTRGVNGGYSLAKPSDQITLADLIEAIDGPVRLAMCCGDESQQREPECDLQAGCPTREPIQKVHDLFRRFLDQVTLADLESNNVPVIMGFSVGAARPEPSAALVSVEAGLNG